MLMLVSAFIGFVMVFLIWRQDIYNREPFGKILLATIFGGITSIGFAWLLYWGLKDFGIYETIGVAEYFYIVGPVEEISKFVAFLLFVRFFGIKLEEPIDAAIYLACTALGFSLIENYGYIIQDSSLIGVRALISTPAHLIFSTAISVVYITNKHDRHFNSNLAKALGLAILAHGSFDAVVGTDSILKNMGIFQLPLIFPVMAVFWSRKVFSYGLLNSPHRKDLVTALGAPLEQSQQAICPVCNMDTSHSIYLFRGSNLSECSICKYLVLPHRKMVALISYFLPNYKVFKYDSLVITPKILALSTVTHDNLYRKFHRFKIDELNEKFEELADIFRRNFENSSPYRIIFGTKLNLSPEEKTARDEMRDLQAVAAKQFSIFGAIMLGVFIFIGIFVFAVIKFTK
jgi:RsiW-degrading membrane proteinase PrsW (M82 family)